MAPVDAVAALADSTAPMATATVAWAAAVGCSGCYGRGSDGSEGPLSIAAIAFTTTKVAHNGQRLGRLLRISSTLQCGYGSGCFNGVCSGGYCGSSYCGSDCSGTSSSRAYINTCAGIVQGIVTSDHQLSQPKAVTQSLSSVHTDSNQSPTSLLARSVNSLSILDNSHPD